MTCKLAQLTCKPVLSTSKDVSPTFRIRRKKDAIKVSSQYLVDDHA
jgi:hypothetical protein